MLVRCKGYNTCDKKDVCKHSLPHYYDVCRCSVCEIDPPRCECSRAYLRKEKLEKLKNEISN